MNGALKKNEYCLPCAVKHVERLATRIIDGDPMCWGCADAHEKAERAASGDSAPLPAITKPKPVGQCSRGCGRPLHAGRCAKKQVLIAEELSEPSAIVDDLRTVFVQSPFTPSVEKQVKVVSMATPTEEDLKKTAVTRTLNIADVPAGHPPYRKGGRIGDIFRKVMALKPGQALEVANFDKPHLHNTVKAIGKYAAKQGVKLETSSSDLMMYCWIVPK